MSRIYRPAPLFATKCLLYCHTFSLPAYNYVGKCPSTEGIGANPS
jgi:hypothetical protein